jgi:hypothetical protein
MESKQIYELYFTYFLLATSIIIGMDPIIVLVYLPLNFRKVLQLADDFCIPNASRPTMEEYLLACTTLLLITYASKHVLRAHQ